MRRLASSERLLVGVDWNFGALSHAKSRLPQAHFICADVGKMPLKSNTFDCIICTEVLEHLGDVPSALQEFFRLLKARGHLIVTTPNGNGMSGRGDIGHIHYFDFRQLVSLIKGAGFEVLFSQKFGFEVPFVSYLAQAISARLHTRKYIPFASPLNLNVNEFLATNFLVEAVKLELPTGEKNET